MSAPGQERADARALDKAVPMSMREPFLEVLSNAVNAQSKRDWKALYALQWQVAIEHESLEKFASLRQSRDWDLIDFRVSTIDDERPLNSQSADGSWTVIGCAKMKESGKLTIKNGAIKLYRVDGAWFAGEVGIITPLDNGKDWPPCRLKDGVKPARLWTGVSR